MNGAAIGMGKGIGGRGRIDGGMIGNAGGFCGGGGADGIGVATEGIDAEKPGNWPPIAIGAGAGTGKSC